MEKISPKFVFSHGRNTGCPASTAQIPACGITAPGSCLRSDAETLIRVWVTHSCSGSPPAYPDLHTLPCQPSSFLTAFASCMPPGMFNLEEKCLQCLAVTRHATVIEIPLNNPAQPTSPFRNRKVPRKNSSKSLELSLDPVRNKTIIKPILILLATPILP